MADWQYPRPMAPANAPSLPAGLQAAGIGVRIGAWLIDGLIGGFVAGIVFGVGFLLSISPDWWQRLRDTDFTPGTTIPGPTFDPNRLAIAVIAYGLALLAYHAGSWMLFRGSIGQRMLHLQVGSADGGRTLSAGAALVRWTALYGPSVVVAGITLVGVLGSMQVPDITIGSNRTSAVYVPGPETIAALAAGWIAGLASLAWSVALLVTTHTHPAHRGLHDRLAGSMVVQDAPTYWAPSPQWGGAQWGGAQQWGGTAPQPNAGPWPAQPQQWPPQGSGAPWPPQGSGAPWPQQQWPPQQPPGWPQQPPAPQAPPPPTPDDARREP